MLIDIYDVTGVPRYFQGESLGKDDFVIKKRVSLPEILIIPNEFSEQHVNRAPYFQDCESPVLDDIYLGNMLFDYRCCHSIVDDILIDYDRNHVRTYFECLPQYLNKHIKAWQPAEKNVLVVPDNFDGQHQEKLLQDCGLPRDRTMLLWRSVAICLGAREKLAEWRSRVDDRVAIVDVVPAGLVWDRPHLSVAILSLALDEGYLVPKRRVYREAMFQDFYPLRDQAMSIRYANIDNDIKMFWKYVIRRPGCICAPYMGHWSYFPWENEKASYYLTPLCNIHCWLINATTNSLVKPPLLSNYSYCDEDATLLAMGSGRFMNCSVNNLPTYRDQCEPLNFIVQRDEKVEAVSLFGDLSDCRGGKLIVGKRNNDFFMQKDDTYADFLIYYGELDGDTPLKELTQSLGEHGSTTKQQLTLIPSMIPGQGIARVEVEAYPLISEAVLLDFLKMSPAHDVQGNPKTLNSLNQSIKRSFPIDLPDVQSNSTAWKEVSWSCHRYIEGNGYLSGDIFAHSRWPNLKSHGIERFQRENVFGTSTEINPYTGLAMGVPQDPKFPWNVFFRKLAEEYHTTYDFDKDRLLRIIAWMYQGDNIYFAEVIEDVMLGLENQVTHNKGLKPQAFTLCANALPVTRQCQFIEFFKQQAEKRLDIYERGRGEDRIEKMNHWLRAFSSILMYNNNFLKHISTSSCLECATLLRRVVYSFRHQLIFRKANARLLSYALLSLLFLLRRRKFDPAFLKEFDSENRNVRLKLDTLCEEVQHFVVPEEFKFLARSLKEYLNGEGTLDGIPVQLMVEAGTESSSKD